MTNFISERVIEDILSANKAIICNILGRIPSSFELIARQKILRSGKLDLLYLYEDEILLIELKVVPFYDDIIAQINGYYADLKILQIERKIIDANIRKIILVTSYKSGAVARCAEEGIELIAYSPEEVLSQYFENFKELSYFLKIQSADYGVVRLGLIKPTLQWLFDGKGPDEISSLESRSRKTIKNRLSIAMQLDLVVKYRGDYSLTDFGKTFLNLGNFVEDSLSQEQVDVLAAFIIETPFFSSITYTILSFVETVFVLAKSGYPVATDSAMDFFVKSVGKTETWKAERARETAAYIFSNYACELQFLAKIDNNFYITSKGIQAILILQLNRSIKLIKSQQ